MPWKRTIVPPVRQSISPSVRQSVTPSGIELSGQTCPSFSLTWLDQIRTLSAVYARVLTLFSSSTPAELLTLWIAIPCTSASSEHARLSRKQLQFILSFCFPLNYRVSRCRVSAGWAHPCVRIFICFLFFFCPFFNDSSTVAQCAPAAGVPEHVFYYHFCGSFTVCAKVCVRMRVRVCVCVWKGIKSFGHFAARYLFQFALVCAPSPLQALLPLHLSHFPLYFWHLTKSRKPDPVESIKWACWQHATVSLPWPHTHTQPHTQKFALSWHEGYVEGGKLFPSSDCDNCKETF